MSKRFNPHFSRRTFLNGLGAAAAASPFVPLLNASGQEATAPRRLILFFTPHGTIPDAWKPTGTETAFTFGPILAPLERHKSKVTVLSGLTVNAPGVGAPHTKGPSLLWTASPLLEDQTFVRSDGSGGRFFGWNSAPSVDQVVAEVASKTNPYGSLEFGVRPGGTHPSSRMIYSAAKQPLPPEPSPYAMVDRLFAVGGKTFDQLRAERKSTIDVLKAELDALKPRAGAEERQKLDSHLTALRGIETRLTASPVTCAGPMVGDKIDPNALANTEIIFDRQSDVLAAALSCDVTRVASLQYRVGDNDNDRYTWIGLTGDGHHTMTHAPDTDLDSKNQLITIYTWFAARFAYLLDRLDAVKEGNGTMLDNTLVVWGSELAKGNTHSFTNVPFVVAGGGGGALKPGRFLDLPKTPHNRLLVSLANAMGLPQILSFGASDTGKGPLPRFLG